jgi:hypothetical protein
MTTPLLTLWAESPEEARLFVERAKRQAMQPVDKIYVAKRSSKARANKYTEGEYFATSDDDSVTVYDEVIIAPQNIIDLVQWCTCDAMLSWDEEPICVIEDTTHIVRMNVYQRFPRMIRAAICGVPAVAIQGTRGLNFRLRGDCWGMHRYMRAYAAASRTYSSVGVLPFTYLAGADEARAETDAFEYIKALISSDTKTANRLRNAKILEIEDISLNGYHGHIAPDIQSIAVEAKTVTVKIGAKPEKKSWREKGSGLLTRGAIYSRRAA